MPLNRLIFGLCFLTISLVYSCGNSSTAASSSGNTQPLAENLLPTAEIIVGANRTDLYLPLLKGKKIGLVANQTSVIFRENDQKTSEKVSHAHLVDSLLALNIDLLKVFAPEHGFRGTADAGEKVSDGVDKRSGLPVISLYGANRKPEKSQLEGLEAVVFDIQDVGVRFYTYIATLQLVMEACAESGIPIIVLDRPNPNGHYIDGPTMETEYKGFLGMTSIPLVYGMTIGEYANMINDEGWLEGGLTAELTVIPLENYTHQAMYSLPLKPSPNLPNDLAINLYPSLGLFEGTNINAGRGTDHQFQQYGAPFLDPELFTFKYTPKSNPGAKSPKHLGEKCYGERLVGVGRLYEVSLEWLLKAYQNCADKDRFFNTSGFSKHAGTAKLQMQIEAGYTEEQIKDTWKADLESFKRIREKYLLYP
ncbi:exo-beta-N-acetylmuramidase NamZ family protein [Muriicola soli]|uniref:exo-beta-N-acetylmuramidase NamZ family protein n=1 Tax=Muriicola soli TaxID=2507538 RepID=UPI003CCC740A